MCSAQAVNSGGLDQMAEAAVALQTAKVQASASAEILRTSLELEGQFIDLLARGYGIVEADDEELRVIFRSPETVYERKAPMRDLARFRVRPDRVGLELL